MNERASVSFCKSKEEYQDELTLILIMENTHHKKISVERIICHSQAQICRKAISSSAYGALCAKTAQFLTLSQLHTELFYASNLYHLVISV